MCAPLCECVCVCVFNFIIVSGVSVKNDILNLIGISVILKVILGSMDISTILILLTYEHGTFFHLFVSSSISLINVLYFSVYRFFTSLITFIPKYLIVFDDIGNGIVFLISLIVHC